MTALEERCFSADRFSRDQIEYQLEEANATIQVAVHDNRLVAAAYMLWRRKSPVGRLYSIAVDNEMRGRGLASRLLDLCETEAAWRNCTTMSLEVRKDNAGAIALYRKRGYETVGTLPGYYDDGSDGLRMTRTITPAPPEEMHLKIPFYGQTLEFTCGPAALIMAMRSIRPDIEPTRLFELELWREATLVFMTSGIGGTGPFGLSLDALNRGFTARVLLSKDQTPFFSSVRDPEKRKVIKIVHESLRDRAYAAGIACSYRDFSFADIAVEMRRGFVPIVLISTYHLHGDRAPHWVTLTGFDKRFVYCHDSYEKHYGANHQQARNVRIPLNRFERMRRYGRDLYKSVIFIGPGDPTLIGP